jgi:hypothetical protein
MPGSIAGQISIIAALRASCPDVMASTTIVNRVFPHDSVQECIEQLRSFKGLFPEARWQDVSMIPVDEAQMRHPSYRDHGTAH